MSLNYRRTQGPWHIEADPEHAGKHPLHNNRFIVGGDGQTIIARMSDSITQAADARLMAAAPEMLEALQQVRAAYQAMFEIMPVAWQTFDDICAAAIAKATEPA